MVQISFGSPFSSKVLVCGYCLVTFALTINETLKWLSSLPILMQKSFWWWQCSDRYIISLFSHLHTPFPSFSLSLISLMVSVDVECHVYLESVIYHLAQLQRAKLRNSPHNVHIKVLWMQFNEHKLLQIMSLLFSTLRLVKQSSIVIYIYFIYCVFCSNGTCTL